MKISEMTTAQATDVLVKISAPIESILRDETLNDVYVKIQKSAENNDNNFITIADIISVIPAILVHHSESVYAIVSALSGKTTEEIANQKITQTVQDIKDSLDQDLIDFFHFSRAPMKKREKE